MNSINPAADLPMGFGMTLSQNVKAMRYFSSLSPDQQRQLIDQTHTISSKSEMRSFVDSLGERIELK
jgi:hypothetical protein